MIDFQYLKVQIILRFLINLDEILLLQIFLKI